MIIFRFNYFELPINLYDTYGLKNVIDELSINENDPKPIKSESIPIRLSIIKSTSQIS